MFTNLYTFGINPEAFMDSLPTMGLGMLGIFIVTGIIVLTVATLNFITQPRNKNGK